jgi:hypothetical protein
MKYKLIDETIEHNGKTLYRIQALKDFGDVKAGDLGGWVESERNLIQEGNCWVYDEAKVFDNALISDNVRVFGNACVFENARVLGNTRVFGIADVYGDIWVYGGFIT